jgi:hypothetical protein
MSKVCFITAIYGNYEASCKKFVKQSIPTDFICFTDNSNIIKNGWIIDTTPYHYTNPCLFLDDTYVNSFKNNTHTFNIAKYYKQAFQNIPRLKKYDIIVWLDGTIEIIYDKTSEYLSSTIGTFNIITWHHERRYGKLFYEMEDSARFYRYTSTFWNNQVQPVQDVVKQYNEYLEDGYDESFFDDYRNLTPHFGVWITCFVAFDNKSPDVTKFLDLWYLQTLKYTTQDQIGFPYVVQKTNMIPLTLPNNEVSGDSPHERTQFYIKHNHGR